MLKVGNRRELERWFSPDHECLHLFYFPKRWSDPLPMESDKDDKNGEEPQNINFGQYGG